MHVDEKGSRNAPGMHGVWHCAAVTAAIGDVYPAGQRSHCACPARLAKRPRAHGEHTPSDGELLAVPTQRRSAAAHTTARQERQRKQRQLQRERASTRRTVGAGIRLGVPLLAQVTRVATAALEEGAALCHLPRRTHQARALVAVRVAVRGTVHGHHHVRRRRALALQHDDAGRRQPRADGLSKRG